MTTDDELHRNNENLSSCHNCSALRLTAISKVKRGNPPGSLLHVEKPVDKHVEPNRFFEGLLYVLPPAILLWIIITWLISLF